MTYFNSYSGAVQYAIAEAEKKGYRFCDIELFTLVGMESSRPKEGNTEHLHLSLYKPDDTPHKECLHISVYNRGNNIGNNMELNSYIL